MMKYLVIADIVIVIYLPKEPEPMTLTGSMSTYSPFDKVVCWLLY
jgi:hypothetical protein